MVCYWYLLDKLVSLTLFKIYCLWLVIHYYWMLAIIFPYSSLSAAAWNNFPLVLTPVQSFIFLSQEIYFLSIPRLLFFTIKYAFFLFFMLSSTSRLLLNIRSLPILPRISLLLILSVHDTLNILRYIHISNAFSLLIITDFNFQVSAPYSSTYHMYHLSYRSHVIVLNTVCQHMFEFNKVTSCCSNSAFNFPIVVQFFM